MSIKSSMDTGPKARKKIVIQTPVQTGQTKVGRSQTRILKYFVFSYMMLLLGVGIFRLSYPYTHRLAVTNQNLNSFPESTANSVVAWINFEPITEPEFKMWLFSFDRANTFAYFNRKYGAEDSSGFWNQSFNGEIPAAVAKQKALQELTKIKVQQILAQQNGIIADISYQKFLENLKQENQQREAAVKHHQVIFGPVQYEPEIYYQYLLDQTIQHLKEKLADTRFKAGDLKYIDQEYPKLVDRLVKEAKVKVNTPIFNRIDLR
jgi:hypothetical protein